ncbi:hypothetical protein DRO59_06095 [Candidatus Bathyarchaeota archaeon]|nr:MAG: hypothetical protein DRO59_06095 [Candidatus Bathyarchaeota archaeon]
MSRAVPGVKVTFVEILKEPDGAYWIHVTPDHIRFWRRFKCAYPQWRQELSRYESVLDGVEVDYKVCPEFFKRGELIDWLLTVLGLPKGVRNLLQIHEGCVYND